METASQTGPSRLPLPPALIVGRERERRLLSDLFVATTDGGGRLVLVGGEAGIGKTALVGWLAEEATRQGALVLTGGCYDLTVTPPYGPWLDAFERYQPVDGVPQPPQLASDATTDTQTWFDTVQTFLRGVAARQPLVVILEDLHWSDPASLDLLRHLARRRDRLPGLLVATYRNDEITREHPLFQILPLLVREADAERLDLRRLDRAAIVEKVAGGYDLSSGDLARLVSYLASHSDGNPLYLAELLRTLEAERLLHHDGERWTLLDLPDTLIPPMLHQVIDRRLGRLQPDTRDALAIAAIIGYEVPIELWAAVSGLSDEQLAGIVEEAVEAHVLGDQPGGRVLSFSHALVREAIHEKMPLPRRRVWHRRAAEALIAAPNPSPDEVAYHFQHAGDARAIEWFVRAGMRARRTNAWITAAERLTMAADLIDEDDTRVKERGWLHFYAAYLLRFSGNPWSIRALDAAEQTARAIGDPVLAAYACYTRGSQRCMQGDIQRGLLDIRQGVAAIDALLETQHVSHVDAHALAAIQRLLLSGDARHKPDDTRPQQSVGSMPKINSQRGILINWLGKSGRYDEAITVGEAFIDEMLAAFDDRYLMQPHGIGALLGLGHAYAGLGRPEDARTSFAIARTAYNAQSDFAMVEDTIAAELLMVHIPYGAEQIAERVRLLKEDIEAWDRCRGVTITTAGDGAPGELPLDVLEGRWSKARQLATHHLPAPWVTQVQEAIVTLGVLDRQCGEHDRAWERVHQVLPKGPATEPGDSYFAHAISAIALAVELALDASDPSTVRRWIDTHSRWLNWSGARLWRSDHQLLWARYHEQSGDLALARQHAEATLRLASDPRQPLRIVAAHRLLGQLDTREQRYDCASVHLAQSLTLANACAAPFEQALSLLALAELHVANGQASDARALLAQARSICVALEARPTLDRVAELEARSGVTCSYPDGLTAREAEVLRLIAAGHSNRQIADTLFISPRTIERHIANIYLKIGAHSKTEATAYAKRNSIA